MPTRSTSTPTALFGGTLLCAGLSATAMGQQFVLDENAYTQRFFIEGYDNCLVSDGDCIPDEIRSEIWLFLVGPNAPAAGEPVVSVAEVGGSRFEFDQTPTRLQMTVGPATGSTPNTSPVLNRAYAYVDLTATAAANIEYEVPSFIPDSSFGIGFAVDGALLEPGTTGTITVPAGASIQIGGRSFTPAELAFRLEIVGRPGCNPSDVAPPFGVFDLADIDLWIDAYFINLNFDIGDIAEPFGIYDLADIDAFVRGYLAGCD